MEETPFATVDLPDLHIGLTDRLIQFNLSIDCKLIIS